MIMKIVIIVEWENIKAKKHNNEVKHNMLGKIQPEYNTVSKYAILF